MIPLSELLLVASFVHAILYGLYIATSILCIRWLVFVDEGWQVRQKIQRPIFTFTVILLFIFSTAVLGTSFPMVLAENSSQGTIYYKLGLLKSVMGSTSLIIMDAVLIYRCWALCERSWCIVFLPLLLWSSTIACAMVLTYSVGTNASISFPIRLNPFATTIQASLLVCNLATNLYTTCAILYRILPVARRSRSSARQLYRSICHVIAGTGILYAVTSFTLVLSIFLQLVYRNLQRLCPILDVVNFSMAGIAFNLLVIRVGQLRSDDQWDANYNSR